MQFDQFANQYEGILDRSVAISGEDSGYFAEYKARYLSRLLGPSFSGNALEFGCGVGRLSRFIKQLLPAIKLDGFDVSGESIRRVDPSLSNQGVFTSDSTKLKWDYQLIVIANVMHHIPVEQRQSVVQALADRMASEGMLVIFEHNPANPITRWVVERCPFDADAALLSPKETRAYLTETNLEVERHDFIVFIPRFLAWLRPVEPWLANLPLGAQYAMVARKYA